MVINGKAYTATVTDTAEGRNFLGMLPLHVRISRGEHDFCGDMPPLTHSESSVKNGFRNRDIAYWVPGHDFVIFVNGEEHSSSIGGIVHLGKLQIPQNDLLKLSGTLDVRILKK